MSKRCDLCGLQDNELAEYHLCQRHMNECVIGERDLKAERDEARAFAQKQYDRAELAEARLDAVGDEWDDERLRYQEQLKRAEHLKLLLQNTSNAQKVLAKRSHKLYRRVWAAEKRVKKAESLLLLEQYRAEGADDARIAAAVWKSLLITIVCGDKATK